MKTYPRWSSPDPNLMPTVFPDMTSQNDIPSFIEIRVTPGSKDLVFVYVAQLALLAKKFNLKYSQRLSEAVYKYLVVDGKSADLIAIISEAIHMDVTMIPPNEDQNPTHSKRAGADRIQKFERRLAAYESVENHSVKVLEAIDRSLANLGYPTSDRASRLPYEDDGRRVGTTATMLEEAIKNLDETTLKSGCIARFERLATQVWGWQYPVLTDDKRDFIMKDFRKTQAEFVSRSSNPDRIGCPNATIRMLWHFERAGVPYSVHMFNLPKGEDSWDKNIADLGATKTWKPPYRDIKKMASGRSKAK